MGPQPASPSFARRFDRPQPRHRRRSRTGSRSQRRDPGMVQGPYASTGVPDRTRFLMALSHALAAETEELAFEDFAVETGPDRSVADVAREVTERVGWPIPTAPLDSFRAVRRTTAPRVGRPRMHP